MATPVEMPQLGNSVEECILTRWLKHEGDAVSAGDMVAEIETDKTTFEVTSPVDGTVIATFFEEGALVPVFTNIFVVGEPGERVEAFRPDGPAARVSDGPEARETDSPEARWPDGPEAPVPGSPRAAVSPRAARFAAAHGIETTSIAGSGPRGRVIEDDVRRANERQAAEPSSDPSTGSGSSRAKSRDEERRANSEQRTADSGQRRANNEQRTEPRTAIAGLRATIARRMRESLSTTAQYTLHSSADATGLLAARARLKTSATPGVTINDLVAFCTIQALIETPAINAELIDGRIVPHAEVHLGFAADTPKGLLAPVVRNAHTLTIEELAARMKELTAQAVAGTIAPDDLTGGTFTVSNLGSLGIETFTPVINTPQVAILGVSAIQTKPVRRNGDVVFVDTIGLSLTCDHQVIDGAPGARFLRVLADKIARAAIT